MKGDRIYNSIPFVADSMAINEKHYFYFLFMVEIV